MASYWLVCLANAPQRKMRLVESRAKENPRELSCAGSQPVNNQSSWFRRDVLRILLQVYLSRTLIRHQSKKRRLSNDVGAFQPFQHVRLSLPQSLQLERRPGSRWLIPRLSSSTLQSVSNHVTI